MPKQSNGDRKVFSINGGKTVHTYGAWGEPNPYLIAYTKINLKLIKDIVKVRTIKLLV